MKPLGEGAEGRAQLTLGEVRVEVGAQLPKLLEGTPLRRREAVGQRGVGGRGPCTICDRRLARLDPGCTNVSGKPTGLNGNVPERWCGHARLGACPTGRRFGCLGEFLVESVGERSIRCHPQSIGIDHQHMTANDPTRLRTEQVDALASEYGPLVD